MKKATKSSIVGALELVNRLLQGETLDVETVRRILGFEKSGANRQLKRLEEGLKGLVKLPGRPKRYRFNRAMLGGAPHVSVAVAACFASSLAPLFAGTSYEAGMIELRDYVHRLMASEREFSHIDRKFVFLTGGGDVSLPDRGGMLDSIIDALLEQEAIRVDYRHFNGDPEQGWIQPLSLLVHQHQLYVLARKATGELHPFRFSRIREVSEEQGLHFEYPARTAFDPKMHFANCFGVFLGTKEPVEKVVLHFGPKWRLYADTHRWHANQRIEDTPEGFRLHLEVKICPELKSWILGFGPDVVVEAPNALQAEIAKTLSSAAARYSS